MADAKLSALVVATQANNADLFYIVQGGVSKQISLTTYLGSTDFKTGVNSAVVAASDTVAGKVELATTAEVVTGTDTTRAVTAAGVRAALDALLDGAPGTLDTLNELAAAINDDAAFSATVVTALAGKQPLATVLTNTTAAFTSALETKLNGIEALADVTDATNVDAAGAVMNTDQTWARIINTNGNPGVTVYVGTINPNVSYTPATGDVWLDTTP